MARSWSTALRLVVGVLAAMAIVAMHGSSAGAHACDTADHAGGAHQAPVDPADGEHRSDAGHDHGSDHSSDHGGDQGGDVAPGHGSTQEPGQTSGSGPAHCSPVACTALVAPSAATPTVPVPGRCALQPDPRLPLVGTTAAPEPPVPRSSSHT